MLTVINSLNVVCLLTLALKSSAQDFCSTTDSIDGIAYIDSYRVQWALTKAGYLWIIGQIRSLGADGDYASRIKLPYGFSIGDAVAVKDISNCADPDRNQFAVIVAELVDRRLQYIAYDMDSGNLSLADDLSADILFGRANINYKKKLDAMFNGYPGQLFFIQGDSYAEVSTKGVECPTVASQVESHAARSLVADLRIVSPVDAAYFVDRPDTEGGDYDWLYVFKRDIVYEIKVKSELVFKGILSAIDVREIGIREKLSTDIDCKRIPIETNTDEYMGTTTATKAPLIQSDSANGQSARVSRLANDIIWTKLVLFLLIIFISTKQTFY